MDLSPALGHPRPRRAAAGAFAAKRSERPATRFQQHGPVRVSASGYHLEHLDGTPFFFLSDTAWNGVLLSKEDHWETYLKDRVAKRFTAVQFVILSPWRAAPTNAEGQVGFEVRDGKLAINPGFYDRIDRRMDQLEAAGLLSVPVLMWAWGKKDAGQSLSEEDAARVIRYEVARYGAHPVLWILNGDGNYRGPVAERWKKIGRAVFAEKSAEAADRRAYHPAVTLHPGGSQWPYAEFRDEAWLDVWGYQSSHSDSPANFKWINAGPVSREWSQFRKVYINLEPPYEDHVSGFSKKRFDAFAVRRAAWWSVLAAPAAGVSYGGHGIWSWQEVAGLPFDHPYTGVAQRWQEAVELPGADFDEALGLVLRVDRLPRPPPCAATPARTARREGPGDVHRGGCGRARRAAGGLPPRRRDGRAQGRRGEAWRQGPLV